ncbi:hypothetical protein SEA_GIBBLES_29 [Gordonia phage Gibbles]|nr:hypothetical protein SEA_GIBBLES_29 [Gordonia phage Gibbles]
MNVPANVFQIKTLADWRVFLAYVGIPVIVTLAVAKGWATESVATQIGVAVLAAIPTSLAVFTSTDSVRRWVYLVVGAVAPVFIAFGWVSDSEWQLWLPVITLFLGNGAAAQNAPTSTPYGEVLNRAA